MLKTKFNIPENVSNELIQLILNTNSMADEERQYWFDLLPSMSEIYHKRLFDILETERQKLEALNLEYQKELENSVKK